MVCRGLAWRSRLGPVKLVGAGCCEPGFGGRGTVRHGGSEHGMLRRSRRGAVRLGESRRVGVWLGGRGEERLR